MSKGLFFNKKKQAIALPIQQLHMMNSFPGFKYIKSSSKSGYWIGELKPKAENGNAYTVKIVYEKGFSPDVFVISPKLLRYSPHRYPDGSLCLYYPKDKSYDCKQSIISDTIVPWTVEWLYFYEKWLDTGVWWGKEAPHPPRVNRKREEKFSI